MDSMEEGEPKGISNNDFIKEDDRFLSDTKINHENKQIREQECIDYDKEIKYPKTIGGHKEDALAHMDFDDPIIPKNGRDPKRTLDSPVLSFLRVPKQRNRMLRKWTWNQTSKIEALCQRRSFQRSNPLKR